MLNLPAMESRGAAQSTLLSQIIILLPADGTSWGRDWFLGMYSSHTVT